MVCRVCDLDERKVKCVIWQSWRNYTLYMRYFLFCPNYTRYMSDFFARHVSCVRKVVYVRKHTVPTLFPRPPDLLTDLRYDTT